MPSTIQVVDTETEVKTGVKSVTKNTVENQIAEQSVATAEKPKATRTKTPKQTKAKTEIEIVAEATSTSAESKKSATTPKRRSVKTNATKTSEKVGLKTLSENVMKSVALESNTQKKTPQIQTEIEIVSEVAVDMAKTALPSEPAKPVETVKEEIQAKETSVKEKTQVKSESAGTIELPVKAVKAKIQKTPEIKVVQETKEAPLQVETGVNTELDKESIPAQLAVKAIIGETTANMEVLSQPAVSVPVDKTLQNKATAPEKPAKAKKQTKTAKQTKHTADNPDEPRIIWNNDLLQRYKKYIAKGKDATEAWTLADIERKDELDKEINKLNKIVDGQVCLIGSLRQNGTSFPAARNLKTDNVGVAVRKAVDFLSKTDSKLTLYLADNELVISQYTINDMETPSVFSFRCVPVSIDTKKTHADDLAAQSTSVAPLVRRVHRWKMSEIEA